MSGEIIASLELARELLEGDCRAFVDCHTHPVSGLSPADEHVKRDYTAAIAAVTAAAAKLRRLTAQAEHLEDARLDAAVLQAQVDFLQAERDALAARLAEIERAEVQPLYARPPAADHCEDVLQMVRTPAAEPARPEGGAA